jgi:hypothetical protein
VDDKDLFHALVMGPTNFPFAIEPGEKFEYKIPMASIIENLKNKGAKKIRFRVVDTHSRTYYSNWRSI